MGSFPLDVRIMYGSSLFQTMRRSIAGPMQWSIGFGFSIKFLDQSMRTSVNQYEGK